MRKKFLRSLIWFLALTAVTILPLSGHLLAGDDEVDWAAGRFAGSREEVETFMAYNRSIQLTAPQEAIRTTALKAIPAPCCSKFSAATCCCECNLTRSIWGLAKHLITERGAGAEQVRQAVTAWIDTLNPGGYPGDTCFTGGCNKAFKKSGCGGMRESKLIF